MAVDKAVEAMQKSICSSIELEELGPNEYLVHTGFTYADGDELHIVLKQNGPNWTLTDEGHTIMWLTYTDFNLTSSRKALLTRVLNQNNVSNEDGRLFVGFPRDNVGPALYSLVQAIIQVADLTYLERQQVASTFLDDLKGSLRSSSLGNRCSFDKQIELPSKDSFTADAYIEGTRPIVIFGIYNTDRCRDALINILLLQKNQMNVVSVVVLDSHIAITSHDRSRLENNADRILSGIGDVEQGISRLCDLIKA